MSMQMTEQGLLALARFEGLVPAPYLDTTGTWTFGIGHTGAAGAPDPRTMPRGMPDDLDTATRSAFHLFRSDLARYEADVRSAVKVPLEPHEFDALVSFHYNTLWTSPAWQGQCRRHRLLDATIYAAC